MKRILVVFLVAGCGQTPGGGGGEPDSAPTADAAIDGAALPISCSGFSPQPLNSTWTIRSGGRDRNFEVHVPAGLDPETPTSVVLNFHGFSSSAATQALISRMIDKSDAAGFIEVHATGVGLAPSWNGGTCCGTAQSENVDDVAFVSDLISEMSRRVCVDPARVYATGLSNGGFLSHRLACELADRIAAIAPVAGVLGVDDCAPSRPVPVLHFHGTADAIVPYQGSAALGFRSVDETGAAWAAINNCSGAQNTLTNGAASCESATGCDAGGALTICTISGGGHTWPGGVPIPGGGVTTTDISATDTMWDFFVAHPHPNP